MASQNLLWGISLIRLSGWNTNKLSNRRDSACWRPLHSSRLFKVINFGISWRPACHLLLLNKIDILYRSSSKLLHTTGHIFAFHKGVTLFNAFVLSNICEYHYQSLLRKNGVAFWKCWRAKFECSSKCVEVDNCVDSDVVVNKFASYFSAAYTFVQGTPKLWLQNWHKKPETPICYKMWKVCCHFSVYPSRLSDHTSDRCQNKYMIRTSLIMKAIIRVLHHNVLQRVQVIFVHSHWINLLSLWRTHPGVGDCGKPLRVHHQLQDTEDSRVNARRSERRRSTW